MQWQWSPTGMSSDAALEAMKPSPTRPAGVCVARGIQDSKQTCRAINESKRIDGKHRQGKTHRGLRLISSFHTPRISPTEGHRFIHKQTTSVGTSPCTERARPNWVSRSISRWRGIRDGTSVSIERLTPVKENSTKRSLFFNAP